MSQKCSVCHHPKRTEIEQALIIGDSLRDISGQFGPSKTAIARHRPHIADAIIRSIESRGLARTATLLEDIQVGRARAELLYSTAEHILNTALQKGEQQTALAAIKSAVNVLKEARGFMELSGQITGELQQSPTTQITIVMPAPVSSPDPLNSCPAIDITPTRG
jgi:hypothetical protein